MAVLRIGLISDTHGLLRPEAVAFLQGSDHIIHAGDIGNAAVRGNNDHGPWAEVLPEVAIVQVESTSICVVHGLKDLTIDPAAARHRVVVAGHSHRPCVEERNGVLYVNPGSAGPRRFRLPVAVAELFVDGGFVSARWVELEIGNSG